MTDRKSQAQKPKKKGFSHNLWIADENGNIFFIKRDERNADRLQGYRVSTAKDKFNFKSKDELTTGSGGRIFEQTKGKNDVSVAIVKMLLATGVATAAIPRDILNPGPRFTAKGTSYVISLASFDKRNAFWPDENLTTKIVIKPDDE